MCCQLASLHPCMTCSIVMHVLLLCLVILSGPAPVFDSSCSTTCMIPYGCTAVSSMVMLGRYMYNDFVQLAILVYQCAVWPQGSRKRKDPAGGQSGQSENTENVNWPNNAKQLTSHCFLCCLVCLWTALFGSMPSALCIHVSLMLFATLHMLIRQWQLNKCYHCTSPYHTLILKGWHLVYVLSNSSCFIACNHQACTCALTFGACMHCLCKAGYGCL